MTMGIKKTSSYPKTQSNQKVEFTKTWLSHGIQQDQAAKSTFAGSLFFFLFVFFWKIWKIFFGRFLNSLIQTAPLVDVC